MELSPTRDPQERRVYEMGSSGGGDNGRWAVAAVEEPGDGQLRRRRRMVGSSGGDAGRWAAAAVPMPGDGQWQLAAASGWCLGTLAQGNCFFYMHQFCGLSSRYSDR
jgi:hypothetical protein